MSNHGASVPPAKERPCLASYPAIANCEAFARSEAEYWTEPYGVCEWGTFTHGQCEMFSNGQVHVECTIPFKARDCSPDLQG